MHRHAFTEAEEQVWNALPGAVQGAVSVALGHPLDTLKTRMQSRSRDRSLSALRVTTDMLRQEGVASFYRGVVPPLLLSATKRGVQLQLFDRLLQPTTTATSTHVGASAQSASPSKIMSSSDQPSWWVMAGIPPWTVPFLSGGLAGGAGTVVGCPMHVIKIQTQDTTRSDQRNGWTCAKHIWQLEGVRGFYRGIKQHLAKDVLFAAMYLGLYQTFKSRLLARRAPTANSTKVPPGGLSMSHAFISGSCASIVTWTVLFPLDVLKTRMQAKTATSAADVWLTFCDGGLRSWFRGWGTAMLRSGPVSGVAMIAYEYTKKHCTTTTSTTTQR